MASFGPGVTRTLSAQARQFLEVVLQRGKPPLDSELNLVGQISEENLRNSVAAQSHSGWFADPTRARADFVADPSWSNYFLLGRQNLDEDAPFLWATVNGWVIPVAGTVVNDLTSNQINLNPPPGTAARTDLVFLEVWQALVSPNPSEVNKPSSSTIWKYGNVEYGGTNLPDDLEDPSIGFQTTKRVQLQYRLRVVGAGAGLGSSVALDRYPDGLGDPTVLGQGTATSPVGGFAYTNMRTELGDPGLYRAGDGDPDNSLGTVDGYVYAIPVCAIFRRNSSGFEAIAGSGSANQNGALDRNPSASTLSDPRAGAKTLSTPLLSAAISASATGALAVSGLTDSGFDDPNLDLASTFLRIDDEILGPVTAVGGSTLTITTRGRAGTMAVPHAEGAEIRFFTSQPEGLFADQIADQDILDLRHAVSLAEWDYQQLLVHNLANLLQGQMQTSYKQSITGGTQGVRVLEVAYLSDASTTPISAIALDAPDGIRTMWSDAATLQSDVTVCCDDAATQTSGVVASFDAGVSWDVGAGFNPNGFMTSSSGFANGSAIYLHIGGTDGSEGARGTFRDPNTRAVRFVAPFEYWRSNLADTATGLQTPFRVRFLGEATTQTPAYGETTTDIPGPMYPLASENFEKPYIVLGGILNSASLVGGITAYNNSPASGQFEIRVPGLDFNTVGGWRQSTVSDTSPTGLTYPVLRGERNLYDMLTAGGQDASGSSSEVYLVLRGDATNPNNNGAFRVIGAGTAGYTSQSASAADRLRVEALTEGWTSFTGTAASITAEIRSQWTNAEDGPGGSASAGADGGSLVLVFTDIENATWGLSAPVASKMVISSSLQYHPGRGAMARVPNALWTVAAVSAGVEYLREAQGSLDSTFPAAAGTPSNQTYFDPQSLGTWNRLPSLGLSAPYAPAYGGAVVSYSEQDRDGECFVDLGSKSLLYRPYLQRDMTLQKRSLSTGSYLGSTTYPDATPKDGASLFAASLRDGYEVPLEYMPRFGRQDIPFHQSAVGSFYPGVNHLFVDTASSSETQFNVLGGRSAGSGGGVLSLLVQTGSGTGYTYGEYGTILGPSSPAYQGRLYSSTAVISADLGRGLKGIQLPPYLGVGRLYGVYDRRDYVAKGGATFNSDRITPATDPATNLLRRDATKQTLFILQNGAEDLTTETGDHTYIIPEDVLDIQLSPEYVSGEEFADLDYVVEFVCFGFAKDWINGNNYVLARRFNGQGNAAITELDACSMVIPAAAPAGDTAIVGYARTPYQGDPYMTRAGSTRVTSDYQARYGQIDVGDAFELTSSIQQFTSSGTLIPQTPNRRNLQVLASVDFYTTLGTGKVGGGLYAGTSLDAGYTAPQGSSRLPASGTAPAWRVLTRAFTEGQDSGAGTRASIGIESADYANAAGTTVIVRVPGESDVTLTCVSGAPANENQFRAQTNNTVTATNLSTTVANHSVLGRYLRGSSRGTTVATLEALERGASGNLIQVQVSSLSVFGLILPPTSSLAEGRTTAFLSNGKDYPVNAGNGTTQVNLTGMTERLPLGILLQDSDFVGENPLGDNTSAMATRPQGIQPVQALLPLAQGQEYTRFVGGPGQWVLASDGGILEYAAYSADTEPTGTQKFRLYRGGGAVFVSSGDEPGGPVDWTAGSFPAVMTPVLKGGVLVCKALLVRNLPEVAFATPATTTQGDEVQMVILTYGILGDGSSQTEGINLVGVISPTGYGEGYAAADRYRLEGRPLLAGRSRVGPNEAAEPALYPGEGADPNWMDQ